jgi:hypothetical protein
MHDDTNGTPSPPSSPHASFRAALTVAGIMAGLLACGIACGLGAGGWVDYGLFLLWALGTTAGVWWSIRKRGSPIQGAVLGGAAGVIVFICYVFSGFVIAAAHLAFFTRTIDPLLHPPTENALGYAAMLLMGIVTSLFVGTAARLAGEGLAVRAHSNSAAGESR